MKYYDRKAAPAAQKKYCADNGLPRFAPYDGVCCFCRRNIYDKAERYDGSISPGIDIIEAGRTLITGCPHCHRTFCD